MPDRVIDTGADAHEAVQAWHSLNGTKGRFDRVDVLRETSKTRAYRLHLADSHDMTVIAKRMRRAAIAHERVVYDVVLPQLPVRSLHCYGHVDDEAAFSWIFLEDAGGRRLSYDAPGHLEAATRWLANAHAAASSKDFKALLPDRGAGHYREHLHASRKTLVQHANNRNVSSAGVQVIGNALALMERLDARWRDIDSVSSELPATFVHGDFISKNLHVREEGHGLAVLPFDWETAGWGVPAPDLIKIDVGLYVSILNDVWSGLNAADWRQMRVLSILFRQLASIDWIAGSFGELGDEKPAMKLALYSERLACAMHEGGWN